MRVARLSAAVLAATAISGCIISTGPKESPPNRVPDEPFLRVGEVRAGYTGSWTSVRSEPGSLDSAMRWALAQRDAAPLFSGDPSALTLDLAIVADHEDDGPRLAALGLLSMATLGVVPLYYSSEWDVRCDARIRTGDGREIARYPLQETGTYKIVALPPTMFSLLGAGVRGASDYKAVEKKVAASLAAQLIERVATDQARLARLRRDNVASIEALGGGPSALLERGRMLFDAGRTEAARAELMRYAEHDPRFMGELDGSDALRFFDTDRRQADTVRAIARARQAEQSGDVATAFREIQRAYALTPGEDGEVEQLRGELQRLFVQLPQKPPLPEAARRFFVAGEEQARREQYGEAADSFRKATVVAPWYPRGWYNRALLLERLERYDQAAQSMRTFLALDPGSEHARVARDRLYQWQGRSVPAAPR
jgi:tetratricopeptide (TPR) repeat protein